MTLFFLPCSVRRIYLPHCHVFKTELLSVAYIERVVFGLQPPIFDANADEILYY